MPDALPGNAIVLRRTPKSQMGNRGVFTPNANDTNGLSVYLESESLTPFTLRHQANDPDKFCVVWLRVSELNDLGLTVIPDDDPNNPGHCLIPEFTLDAYKSDKTRWVKIQTQLLGIVQDRYV